FSFGESLTGMQAVSTALILRGRGRISYIAGNDSSDFQMLPVSPTAGGITHTVQALGQTVLYLDDAGVRRLSSSGAFGGFRLGTLTQAVEPVVRRKRANGVKALASLVVKAKDQYRLFFDDRTGIVVYLGRKDPDTMPFLYPIDVFCTCSGEIVQGQGDRYFVGAEDGYVYELDSGTS